MIDAKCIPPREPTEEMIAAGWIDKEDVSPREIWQAMWDAAPASPSSALDAPTVERPNVVEYHVPTVEACIEELRRAHEEAFEELDREQSVGGGAAGGTIAANWHGGKVNGLRTALDCLRALTSGAEEGERDCTCHPDDRPPGPCRKKYAAKPPECDPNCDDPMCPYIHTWGSIERPEPAADAGEVERRPWRIGRHFPIHIYEGDVPIATAQVATYAKQIVADHNTALRPAPSEEQVERAVDVITAFLCKLNKDEDVTGEIITITKRIGGRIYIDGTINTIELARAALASAEGEGR